MVEFLRFVSLTSNQNAKKEARDFIKDVYQFIDQCGGVSDEQRMVFKSPAPWTADFRARL